MIEKSRKYCSKCLSFDGSLTARVITTRLTNPATGCMIRRYGRLGWYLDEIKGPRNSSIERRHEVAIEQAFDEADIPSDRVIFPIKRILNTSHHVPDAFNPELGLREPLPPYPDELL